MGFVSARSRSTEPLECSSGKKPSGGGSCADAVLRGRASVWPPSGLRLASVWPRPPARHRGSGEGSPCSVELLFTHGETITTSRQMEQKALPSKANGSFLLFLTSGAKVFRPLMNDCFHSETITDDLLAVVQPKSPWGRLTENLIDLYVPLR